ncbi:GAP1-N2 domain-containing protein [Mycolicibacterium lutetiense]
MTTRYGQLAYTSFDKVGSAGGWQVKESTGGLTADETQQLIAGIRTVFHAVEPLPAYPTPEQLERGPRRLAYRPLDGGAAGYWHSIPAGSDSTGRPGNVFAHVLLDRQPEAVRRPIEWWRSAQWLRPYGPAAVARAALPPRAPESGAVVTKDSVVAFALDPSTWRLTTLFGLLDAIVAALAGGPPVVLGAESAESAAQWIGLVSFLMSAGTAAELSFSTFDRADQLALALQGGQHLTAVPIGDLGAVPPGVVSIGETELISLGELGGEPHRTAAGQAIEVTAWSAMAQVALLDPTSARTLLDDIDRFAAEVPDAGLHPAWPMAMAVTANAEFADAIEEAHDVVTTYSPPGVPTGSAAAQAIAGVLGEVVGTSTAEAWQAVQNLPNGAAADFADVSYLRRALTDDAWLTQAVLIPLGPRSFHGKATPAEVQATIGPALQRARDTGPERVLKVVDLLLRAGVQDDRLVTALRSDVVAQLDDPSRAADLTRRLGAEGRLTLAAALLRTSGGDVAAGAIDDGLLDWLAEGVDFPTAAELSRVRPWDSGWTRAAVRGVRAVRRGPSAPGDRVAELWWLGVSGSPRFVQVAGDSVWDPADLLAVVGDGALPGAAAVRTLLGAPDSPELDRLATKVIDGNDDSAAVAHSAVRHITPQQWMQQRYVDTHQRAYLPFWEKALATARPGEVHRDFSAGLLTFAVLGTIAGQPFPNSCHMLAADPELGAEAVRRVLPLVDGYEISPHVVMAVSLLHTVAAEDTETPVSGVEAVLAQLAEQVAAPLQNDDHEVEGAATLMAQMSGDMSDGALRRYRKMVSRLLTHRADAQPSLAARLRGSR